MIETSYSIPHKYTVCSPITTPEYYTDTVPSVPRSIQGLYIPADLNIPPQMINKPIKEALPLVFKDSDHTALPIFDVCHMYFDPHLQYGFYFPNVIATQLFRSYFLQSHGSKLIDVVYGDVLFYGSYNYTTKIIDNKNHSVPYEIVEQVVRLYEAHTAPKSQYNKKKVY